MFWIASLACSTVLTVPLRKMSCNFLGSSFLHAEMNQFKLKQSSRSIYIIRQGLHNMSISLNVSCGWDSGIPNHVASPREWYHPAPDRLANHHHSMEWKEPQQFAPGCWPQRSGFTFQDVMRCVFQHLPPSSNSKMKFRNKTGTTFFNVHLMVAKDGLGRRRPRHSNLVTQH